MKGRNVLLALMFTFAVLLMGCQTDYVLIRSTSNGSSSSGGEMNFHEMLIYGDPDADIEANFTEGSGDYEINLTT